MHWKIWEEEAWGVSQLIVAEKIRKEPKSGSKIS
jgi:hypothetical protein